MQVFKTYFKILKKHKTSVMVYAFLFLALTVSISSNIKVENEQYKASKVKTMVINEDGQSALVDGFIKYLGDYVIFVEPGEDEDAIKEALFYRKVVYVLTIPEGFSENFLKDGTVKLSKQTVPDSIESMSLDNNINNYFNMAKVYLKHVPNLDYDKLNAYIVKNIENETQVNFDVEVKDDVSYSNGFNTYFFNYLGYIMIAVFITGVSMIMFSFNGLDIRRRHTASPLTSRRMNFQLILANLIFVLGFLIVFMIAGYYLNKSRMINANTLLIWLNALVFSLTALSMSYLIGITVNSRKAIGAISTALSLSLSFLSGIFVPQQYLGASVLRVASFTPTYWYVKANNALENVTSFKWNEMSSVFGYMAIQIGFTIAIISIALVVSKRKRQQAF
ncbi:MAG: ABC transporter permease [Herbinix sp.]|nr:ABC transporter permease [Herbinix sp.]